MVQGTEIILRFHKMAPDTKKKESKTIKLNQNVHAASCTLTKLSHTKSSTLSFFYLHQAKKEKKNHQSLSRSLLQGGK